MYPMKERSTFVALNYFFLNVNFQFYSVKNAGGNTLKCVSCGAIVFLIIMNSMILKAKTMVEGDDTENEMGTSLP